MCGALRRTARSSSALIPGVCAESDRESDADEGVRPTTIMWQISDSGYKTRQLPGGGGELVHARAKHIVRDGHVELSHGAGCFRVSSREHLVGMTGQDGDHAVVLVYVGFGVLVNIEQTAVVQQ